MLAGWLVAWFGRLIDQLGGSWFLLLAHLVVVRLLRNFPFVCFHIMLFCSEFTSEEFSSPRSLWFSCLGVRELWMLRESSSLGGAFTGSSSLFWELGSSYPGREGVEVEG